MCFRSAILASEFIMFWARSRNEGLTCLPGGCRTPSGRGNGGGLLLADLGGVLLEDPEAVLEEASLLEANALVLKNADGLDGPARIEARPVDRLAARRQAEQCWRAILKVSAMC